jgi:uncharacterized protein (TIGR00255 family)
MLKSMTGYGQATGDYDKFSVKAEFKSLNGKFLDVNLRMPKLLQTKEIEIRNQYQKLLERGSVTVNISVELKNTVDLLQPINKEVVNFYLDEIRHIEERLSISQGTLTGSLFNIPNALQLSEKELSDEEWLQIKEVLQKAYINFDSFRKQEGKETEREISELVGKINKMADEVAALEPERMNHIRQKINSDVEAFVEKSQIDATRFEQELIYYIEKIDIAEEKLRLNNHCNYFLQTMKEDSSGKKLGFISQEMGREINTMGSKANYFAIQKLIVQMKDELEKIKEQLSNII